MSYTPRIRRSPLNNTQYLTCFRNLFILITATITFNAHNCGGHGRLIEPPSRASAWRYGFQTPPDYNDHELYCGGFTRQWKRNNGKCGECGDAWDVPKPRPHENGGQWGKGIIVRKYNPGTEMMIRIELTASHLGYFEFRLCPEPNAKQECLDRHLLRLTGGWPALPALTDLETRFYPRNGSRIYGIKAQLPDIECYHCTLQWRYIAGNNWGMCPDGNGAVGCGPQEEFRSCSDIAIGEGDPITTRPTHRMTKEPITYYTSSKPTKQENAEKDSRYFSIFIGFFLLICIGGIASGTWYLYCYRRQQIKTWIETASTRLCRKQTKKELMASTTQHASIVAVATSNISHARKPLAENHVMLNTSPVPPPRSKRQPRFEEILPHNSVIA